jgi:hypothetical protein
MGKLDHWEGPRTHPEDVVSPGDHDALVTANVEYEINLRRVRSIFAQILEAIYIDPGFVDNGNGCFSWHAPGFEEI